MIHAEKGQLAWLVQEVCKGDEGVCFLQVEDEHGCDEGHALHLQREGRKSGFRLLYALVTLLKTHKLILTRIYQFCFSSQ